MDALSLALALFSGAGATALGTYVTLRAERRKERDRRLQGARFEIYMKLLEVDALYFWVVAAEMHGEPPTGKVTSRLRELSWRIADKLREVDEVDHLDEILEILLGSRFPTARERADALGGLIKRYGELVNPRYAKAINRVSAGNLAAITAQPTHRSNAPGSMDDSPGPAT